MRLLLLEYGLGDALLKMRRRRATPLIFPGTNWCGVGNVSSAAQLYGGKVGVDRCCHEHDRCDYTIEGFSTRYGLFNYRFHTLSHCECDDRLVVLIIFGIENS
jgi:secretory phospholipase A2